MNSTNNEMIDLDLVDQVVANIPQQTWEMVKEAIIVNLVDNMPADILVKLTDDPVGFEKAEAILDEYYELPERQSDLIIDAFKILGLEHTIHLLDSMQLNKVVEANVDTTPCLIEPQ
jgi:hypothetical protein